MEGLESLIILLDAGGKGPPGTGYQSIRIKLIRYFEWQRCVAAEELTDETIDRVAKRIAQGQQIENLGGFFYGVARFVLKEFQREEQKQQRALANLPKSTEDVSNEEEDDEAQLRRECNKKCLKELTEAERDLIIPYCQPDGRSKKERRQNLATKLGIKSENLRLKVFRIREKLDKCVADCLKDNEGK
jgi:DNA-directed RNA polymerase specialized sigma24 family protein